MADNVNVPGGSAGPVATDEISGVHHQRVKVQHGADGSATDVSAASPLPVSEIAAGAVLSTAVTVGTSATALPSSALSSRKSMIVFNNGNTTIYLGPSGVTTSSGLPVYAGAYSPAINLGAGVTLYAISGSAGQNVRVFEVS